MRFCQPKASAYAYQEGFWTGSHTFASVITCPVSQDSPLLTPTPTTVLCLYLSTSTATSPRTLMSTQTRSSGMPTMTAVQS